VNFLKQNWFKLTIVLLIVIFGSIFLFNYNKKTDFKGINQPDIFLPSPTPVQQSQTLPKEDPSLKIEQCKTIAQIQADESGQEYYLELLKSISKDATTEQRLNAMNLIAGIVKSQKEKDYNRFYLNCLNQ